MRSNRHKQDRPRPTVSLTLPKPYYDRGGIRLYHGDCLQILPLLPPGSIDGCVSESVKQADKFHMTGKPTKLMCQLVECVAPGSTVLDTFSGSSTTGVACALTGRKFIGIEQSEEYCEISAKRFDGLHRGKRAA